MWAERASKMTTSVCLWANGINNPQAGGHLWVYLNWALGLRSCGLDVIWLESVSGRRSTESLQDSLARLNTNLERTTWRTR